MSFQSTSSIHLFKMLSEEIEHEIYKKLSNLKCWFEGNCIFMWFRLVYSCMYFWKNDMKDTIRIEHRNFAMYLFNMCTEALLSSIELLSSLCVLVEGNIFKQDGGIFALWYVDKILCYHAIIRHFFVNLLKLLRNTLLV